MCLVHHIYSPNSLPHSILCAGVFYTIALKTLILRIMTNNPIVTMMSNANENQPRTMALVPTPDLTAPLPKSCAMTEAATEAVCCQRTDTRTKMAEMKMRARATWETGREGKGLTSRSEPSESSSSCQPGKVARRRRQIKAKIMAMILKTVRAGSRNAVRGRPLTSDMGIQSYL